MKIVFFDCDGTLTTVKSSWQYLHERLDLWDGNADKFQRLFLAGQIDYDEFCRRDAALWKGLPVSRVLDIIGEIPYHEGVEETLRTLKREGIVTVALSTGLSLLVERVKNELDMDAALANHLIVEDGLLTGEISLTVAHDEASHTSGQKAARNKCPSASSSVFKASVCAAPSGEAPRTLFVEGVLNPKKDKGYWVRSVLSRLGMSKAEAAAVGDSEGDRSMFEEVGTAVGYHPSEGVLPFLDHALHNGSFKEVFEVLRARA